MKNKHLTRIIMFLIPICTMIFLSSCIPTSENQNTASENEKTMKTENTEKSETKTPENETTPSENNNYNNPDLIKEEQLIFFGENPVIIKNEDYYELQDVCLAKQVNYNYDYSMFEGKESGNLINLPNGEFRIYDISEVGNETHIDVENGYFLQYFIIQNEEKVVIPIGIGEHIQIETAYEGSIRFTKDCIYEMLSDDTFEYTDTALSEFLQTQDAWKYGGVLFISELDEENNISKVSDFFIP